MPSPDLSWLGTDQLLDFTAVQQLGMQTAHQRFRELVHTATDELTIMFAGRGLGRPDMAQAMMPVLRRVAERGVVSRFLVPARPPERDPHRWRHSLRPQLGEHLRQTTSWPPGLRALAVSNNAAVMVTTDSRSAYLHVGEPVLVAGLQSLADQAWVSSAEPLPRLPALSPRQLALLDLLARGTTDSSAARQLGVSLRTITTEVGRLMDAFEVDSRLQLGMAIVSHRLRSPG